MSLADLVNEARGGQQEVDEKLQKKTARIKEVRTKLSALKKEEEKLRKEILAHPLCKEGYNDESVVIGGFEQLDLENQKLVAALHSEGVFEQAVNISLSSPKIKAIGEKNEVIARAIEVATSRGRKVNVTK